MTLAVKINVALSEQNCQKIGSESVNVPSKHKHEATLLQLFLETAPFQSPLATRTGKRRAYSRLKPRVPMGRFNL